MLFFKLLFIILTWGMGIYTIFQFYLFKEGKTNIFANKSDILVIFWIVLFLIKELLFITDNRPMLIMIMLLLLDVCVFVLAAVIISIKLPGNTDFILNKHNATKVLGVIVPVLFVVLMLTGASFVSARSNQSNETKTHKSHKVVEHFTSYKLNVTSVSETASHKYLKVSGSTKAPNGSKIFTTTGEDDSTTTSSFNDTNESDWSSVKNGKFTTYVSISDVSSDEDYKVGTKLSFISFAIGKMNHSVSYDLSSKELSKLSKNGTTLNYTISKSIHDALYVKDDDDDSSSNVSDIDESTYTDDMKNDISDKISDEISVKKVTVEGQFEINPATMMVSVYSSDFAEDPSMDYIYIIDMIKVIKKYQPEKFDNITVALYGKVATPYETKFMPIQSYSIPGKNIKRVIPDNLSKYALEAISTEHYYAHFNN